MTEKEKKIVEHFMQNMGFTPTQSQKLCFLLLAKFISQPENTDLFVLKGYAGTGKTTLLKALISTLKITSFKYVLMAPTGRAAKVMKKVTGKEATTIHKKIYYPKSDKKGGVSFMLQENKHHNTLFLVDEASMISDEAAEAKFFENGSLLEDLLMYVQAGENCKLIFIGDTAQLPPVKQIFSPALDIVKLQERYMLTTLEVELDEVTRQSAQSGVLYNATQLRNLLQTNLPCEQIQLKIQGFEDILKPEDSHETLEVLSHAFLNDGPEETAVIVRSNKRANLYNQQIRERIFFRESTLTEGDYLMVVKNNYYWLDKKSEAGFIANGDIIEVHKINKFENLYGFSFAHARVRMVDYEKQPPIDLVLLLDTLTSEEPSLSYEDGQKLYQEVAKDFADERSKYKQFLKIKNSPHFNALQVKFAYAITCHKSQGGQWKNVFVEHPWLPNGYDEDALRWLYTAFTRTTDKLTLLGFKESLFE